MDRIDQMAVVASLARRMQAAGSWSGETHLQKATYFYEQLIDPEVGFTFVMYKHGPFSFDLREVLTEMRADGLLELQRRAAPYGPSYRATTLGERLEQIRATTVSPRGDGMDFVAERFGTLTVAELEVLATALFVKKELPSSREHWTARLISLKPHVSRADAERALEEVDRIAAETTLVSE